MKQNQAFNVLKKIFNEVFGADRTRFIKIHGGAFQENGLLDVMILIKDGASNFWIELKRDEMDVPSANQWFNIKDLADRGFVTGIFTGEIFIDKDNFILSVDQLKHKLRRLNVRRV